MPKSKSCVLFLGTFWDTVKYILVCITTAKNTQKDNQRCTLMEASISKSFFLTLIFKDANNTIVVPHLGIGILCMLHTTSLWWSWIPTISISKRFCDGCVKEAKCKSVLDQTLGHNI
jgi:hypothetical protein